MRTLSIPKAAAEVGVGARTIRQLIEDGRLRARHIGKRDRVLVSSIEDFVGGADTEQSDFCGRFRAERRR